MTHRYAATLSLHGQRMDEQAIPKFKRRVWVGDDVFGLFTGKLGIPYDFTTLSCWYLGFRVMLESSLPPHEMRFES